MDDLKFKLTSDMADMTLKVLNIKQLLSGGKLDKKERKELEEEKERLVKQFIKEFQKNNKKEITKYNMLKNTID